MMAIMLVMRVVFGIFWLWARLSKWIYGVNAAEFLQGSLANHAVLATPYAALLMPLVEWSAKEGEPLI